MEQILTRNFMLNLKIIACTILISMCWQNTTHGQTVTRTSGSSCVGVSQTFHFNGPAGTFVTAWSITGNYTAETALSGSTISVHWNSTGAGSVAATYNGNSSGTTPAYSVSISAAAASSVSIAITSSPATKCANSSITFTPTPTNGGTPTYAWYINNVSKGSGNTFTYTSWVNGDQVMATMTSSIACTSQVTSNTITMSIPGSPITFQNPVSGPTPWCSGSYPNNGFSVTPNGAGSNPTYSWMKNGVVISEAPTTLQFYTPTSSVGSTFATGDQITCKVSSTSLACPYSTTASAYVVNVTQTTAPSVGINSLTNYCDGQVINFTANGVTGAPSYSWTLNGGSLPSSAASYPVTASSDPNSTNTFKSNSYVTLTVSGLAGTCLYPTSQTVTSTPITITPIPASPPLAQIQTSTGCYAKTLSYTGTIPGNVGWYWQGTNSSGTDYTSTAAVSTTYLTASQGGSYTYYVRAKANGGSSNNCWSPTSTAVPVFVDNPSAPIISNAISYCEWDQMVLAPDNPQGNNFHWFNAGGQLVGSLPTFTPVGLLPGAYVYSVKGLSVAGCEGTSSSPVTLTVRTNCDDNLNWNEDISYSLDGSGNSIEIAHSKEYLDGFGKVMQVQQKNFTASQIMASQPINNSFNSPIATTLSAPINSGNFAYNHRFVTNASGKKYGPNDFDQRVTSGLNTPGEIKNPSAVGNTNPGTLGWYYSANNTLEPLTPISGYPFQRSYTPEGPNPLTSTVSPPGDAFKMGSGHEAVAQKQTFIKSELYHYFSLRKYFPTSSYLPAQVGPNFLNNSDGSTTTGYLHYYTVNVSNVVQNGETYVQVSIPTAQTYAGVFGIGGNYTVLPNTPYIFRARGYSTSPSGGAALVSMIIRNAIDNANIKFPATALPKYTDGWIEYAFTTPANCTSLSIGLIAQSPAAGDVFYINELALSPILDIENSAFGYKIFKTDSDGKRIVSFTDFDGNKLVSAYVNSDGSFSNYTYFYYNDSGQVVGQIAPNGVIIGNSNPPYYAITYKYDKAGRLIEKKTADQGITQYVYTSDGKIRFSQNQIQRDATPQRFSYTNYDYLGRLVESGEYTSSGTNPYIFQPANTPTPSAYSVLLLTDVSIPSGKDIESITQTDYPAISQKIDNVRCTDYTFAKYDMPAVDYPSGDVDHLQQRNLYGKISKTQNANCITWYSYDERGYVEWSKRSIAGLSNKTLDYVYDFIGNVTQVIYQKNQSDKFYHYYTYDANSQLQKVETSLDGSVKTLQAKYIYYLHGPLKRIEIAGNKQGIDYTYTISGALKGINSSDPNNDPGLDGTSGTANASFSKDAFGETLHYYDTDYTSGGYSVVNPILNSATYPNQFGGLVKAISYNNVTDMVVSTGLNSQHLYGFSYNSVNQLTNSQWANYSGTSVAFKENQREQISGYDKNGNITSLVRKGKQAQLTGSYSYIYESNTNRIDKINNSGSLQVDYTYNSSGQMIKQVEGSNTMNVAYNAQHLVKEVRDVNSQLILSYIYDEEGTLIKKINYAAGAPSKNTWYSRDVAGNVVSIYEQVLPGGGIQQTEIPIYGSGRVATYKRPSLTYFYEVTDNLGNVRALIGAPSPSTYSATLETGTQGYEQGTFGDYSRVNFDLFDHTDAGTTYSYVQLLNGGPSAQVGLSKSLAVSPGDKIKIEVYTKYQNPGGPPVDITTFAAALTSAFNVSAGSTGDAALKYTALNAYGASVSSGTAHSTSGSAGGWATILLFDKNYNLVDASWRPVDPTSALQPPGTTKAAHQYINWEMTVSQPGYAFVFLSNESPTPVDIYFDDLTITHTQSPIVGGSDFYPFGLTMDGETITDEPYRYGYQGQFSEKDLTNGWNEFNLRMYDARFGRWLTPDREEQHPSPYLAMGDLPQITIDADGGIDGIPELPEFVIQTSRLTSAGKLARLEGLVGKIAFCNKCPNPFNGDYKVGDQFIFDTRGPSRGAVYELTSLDPALGQDNWTRVSAPGIPDGLLQEVVVSPKGNIRSWLAAKFNPLVDISTMILTTTVNGLKEYNYGQVNYTKWYSYKLDENGFYRTVDKDGRIPGESDMARNKEIMLNTVKLNMQASTVEMNLSFSEDILVNKVLNRAVQEGIENVAENSVEKGIMSVH